MKATSKIYMTRTQAKALIQEAEAAVPAECCGLLIGAAGKVHKTIALLNVAERPMSEYFADPGELLRALLDIEAGGMDLLAVYHSHPAGNTRPSERDIREATYPQAAKLIIGLGGRKPEMAAWRIENGVASAVPLQFTDHHQISWSENDPIRPWLVAVGALIAFALTMGLALSALT